MRKENAKGQICALFIMAVLMALTACGAGEQTNQRGSQGYSGDEIRMENPEADGAPVSDQTLQETDPTDNGSEDGTGTAAMALSSPELPQPYARYLEALEQIRTEGQDPNGTEYTWEEAWNFENNCFAILDVDNDGKPELLFNFNESFMSAMREVVYAYDEETDTLREELLDWVGTTYYGNGIVKVEMSHNHGKDPEGRGVWPYVVYEYDAEEDSYQLRYVVDSWDGRVHEEDFPGELDVNGDGLLYYVTVEDKDMAGSEDTMIFDWEEYNVWTEEMMPEWSRINVIYHRIKEDFAEKVKSAYAQAAAYAAQAETWFVGAEAGVSCNYLLYDLDGDGSLELTTSVMQGTGRYSDNHFYSLTDDGKVTELELVRLCNSEEREWIADFDIGGRTYIQTYQGSDGVIYYEGNDYTRDGIYGGYDEAGFYYMKGGIMYQDSIRRREEFFHREEDQEDEIHYYSMGQDPEGEEIEITEEQYETIRDEYVKDMTETRVYQNWVYFQWDEIKQENISEETICMKLFESALGSG